MKILSSPSTVKRDASETSRRFSLRILKICEKGTRVLDSSSSTESEIFGKMKSPAFACRKNRSVTFGVDEPYTSAASSSSSSETLLVTRRYCHCPSICGTFEDSSNDASPQPPSGSTSMSTTTCDLCERLRGQTDGCSDTMDAIRTEDFGQLNRPPMRRKRDESANSRTNIVEKRDRTLRCDRLSLYESSSARCASSVVRWNHLAAKFPKSTEWRRLLWIIFLVLLALSPDLAAAKKSNTTIASNKDGGEYIIFLVKNPLERLRYYAG